MERLNSSSHHLELHIEELILQGFPGCDRDRMGSVITQELTRLFTEQGIPRSVQDRGSSVRLPGRSFEVNTGSRVEVTGVEIAQQIYGGITPGD
jgi:hypothetical protein